MQGKMILKKIGDKGLICFENYKIYSNFGNTFINILDTFIATFAAATAALTHNIFTGIIILGGFQLAKTIIGYVDDKWVGANRRLNARASQKAPQYVHVIEKKEEI